MGVKHGYKGRHCRCERELPLVMTPGDIAEALRISRNTAYELVHREGFPAFQVGRQYRIGGEQFMRWLNNNIAKN